MWLWWEMWMRAGMMAGMVASEIASEAQEEPVWTITPETAEYLVRELRADLEEMGVQGIIDEAGR